MSLHVHVLIDLEWKPESGGQVGCWQNLAAAADGLSGLRLTLHAQGPRDESRSLSPQVRLILRRPVFSTRVLPFLHAPAAADLAPGHPALANDLAGAEVIHTTDAHFAYARTAARHAGKNRRPLVHSIHTDAPAYGRIFTRRFLETMPFGAGRTLDRVFSLSHATEKSMRERLAAHEQRCRFVMAARDEDAGEAALEVGRARVRRYRLGVDKDMYRPQASARAALRKLYTIPEDATILAFAGRLDEGKNIYRLLAALDAARGRDAPLFLVAAGEGPARAEIRRKFTDCAAAPGFLPKPELAALYAGADFLVLPSMVETWSLVAAEALCCGTPVIASLGSGVGRFIEREGAGFLVHEDTDAAWTAALVHAARLRGDERPRDGARRAAAFFPAWREVLEHDFLPVWKEAVRK